MQYNRGKKRATDDDDDDETMIIMQSTLFIPSNFVYIRVYTDRRMFVTILYVGYNSDIHR
jgi:hypothetical protein